ncbi:MAG: endonuclease MutS2, partial [Muribaculaceae bacterium]|nr:endonuclease MutS2 [Muribaculaceae bacterium]
MIYPAGFEKKIGFDTVRLRLADLCLTAAGRAYVGEMSFMTEYNSVREAVGAVAEMADILGGANDFPLAGIHDISAALARAKVAGAVVSADDFRAIRRTVSTIAEAERFLRDSRDDEGVTPYPILCERGQWLDPLPELARQIDRVIDSAGNVLDSASPELARIRSELARVGATVNSILRRVMGRAVADGYLEADATPAVRDGRLVLPVSPMNKRKIPGIVHDESASGKTYFIEPAEVVEVNNRVRELEIDERREITRILGELTAFLGQFVEPLSAAVEVMGWFDFVHAKARYAVETDAVMPHLSAKPELEWYRAVHPVLLASLRQRGLEVVPLDICLSETSRILVISGPNAGGKSVTLKTVGIVQYMLQCGMLPTVRENSHMGIFDDIFVDIGDDQSIENDLSTYSSH